MYSVLFGNKYDNTKKTASPMTNSDRKCRTAQILSPNRAQKTQKETNVRMHLLLQMLYSLRDVDNYLYCYWSRLGIVRKRLTINPTKTWSSCGAYGVLYCRCLQSHSEYVCCTKPNRQCRYVTGWVSPAVVQSQCLLVHAFCIETFAANHICVG